MDYRDRAWEWETEREISTWNPHNCLASSEFNPYLYRAEGWLVCVWTWSCWRSCWFPSSVGSVLRVSGPWSFLIKSEDLAVHGQLPEPAEKQEITSLVIFRCFADHRVNVYSVIFVSLISLFWYFQLSSYLFIYFI